MSLAAALLPCLTSEMAAILPAASAQEALSAAEHLQPSVLAILAQRFPAEALRLARPALSSALLRACAQEVPADAIDLGLAAYLTVEEQEKALQELPLLLHRLTADEVHALSVPLLQSLLVVAPEVVLSVIAAVEQLPKRDLAKVAERAHLRNLDVEGRYNAAFWSTYRVSAKDHGYSLRLFTCSIGQLGQGLAHPATKADTNLFSPYLPCRFRVQAVQYAILGGDDADAHRLAEKSTLALEKGSTFIVDLAPLTSFSRQGESLRYGTFYREHWPKMFNVDLAILSPHNSFSIQLFVAEAVKNPVDVRVTLLGTAEP